MNDPDAQGFRIKYLLGSMALSNPRRFLETFCAEGGRAYLRDLWDGLGLELQPDTRVPSDEVRIEPFEDVLVLRLPEPRARNQAFAVGVIGDSDRLRVFVLEKAEVPGQTGLVAMLVELDGDSRANCGAVVDTQSATLAARIREIA